MATEPQAHVLDVLAELADYERTGPQPQACIVCAAVRRDGRRCTRPAHMYQIEGHAYVWVYCASHAREWMSAVVEKSLE